MIIKQYYCTVCCKYLKEIEVKVHSCSSIVYTPPMTGGIIGVKKID